MPKSKIAKMTFVILVIIFIGGSGCLFFVPKLYDIFKEESVLPFSKHNLIYRCAFYSGYIGCLLIIYKLIKLFNHIHKDSPFKKEVERLLKECAVIFMVLSSIVFLKIVFIPTILSFAVAFICFISSLSFYCMAEVIKAAIKYKDEVDATV